LTSPSEQTAAATCRGDSAVASVIFNFIFRLQHCTFACSEWDYCLVQHKLGVQQ
jgi:hypothetical protein